MFYDAMESCWEARDFQKWCYVCFASSGLLVNLKRDKKQSPLIMVSGNGGLD